MPQQGRLRLHGRGEIEVDRIVKYLADVRVAYDSVSVFAIVIDGIHRAARELPFRPYPFVLYSGWPLGPRRGMQSLRDWPPSGE